MSLQYAGVLGGLGALGLLEFALLLVVDRAGREVSDLMAAALTRRRRRQIERWTRLAPLGLVVCAVLVVFAAVTAVWGG